MLFSKNAFNNLHLISFHPSPSYFIKSSIVIFEARELANPAKDKKKAKITLCSKTPVTISLISCSWGIYSSHPITIQSIIPNCSLCKMSDNSLSGYPAISYWWRWHSRSCFYVGSTIESCHPIPTSSKSLLLSKSKISIRQSSQLEEDYKVQFGKREIRLLEEDWNYCDQPSVTAGYVLAIVYLLINDSTYYLQVYPITNTQIHKLTYLAQRRWVNSSWNINTAARKKGRCWRSLNTIPDEIT